MLVPIIYWSYEHQQVCLIPHKYVGHYCAVGNMLTPQAVVYLLHAAG